MIMYTHNTNDQETKNTKYLTTIETMNTAIAPEDLDALRDGCHKAYRKLYLQFVTPLIRYITMITRSELIAEELTQDILAMVWSNRQKIDPTKNIKGYLFTVARHAITNFSLA